MEWDDCTRLFRCANFRIGQVGCPKTASKSNVNVASRSIKFDSQKWSHVVFLIQKWEKDTWQFLRNWSKFQRTAHIFTIHWSAGYTIDVRSSESVVPMISEQKLKRIKLIKIVIDFEVKKEIEIDKHDFRFERNRFDLK